MASSRDMARRSAAAYALEARQKLDVPMQEPVDIYDAIRRSSLWLMFQPLEGLFGLYERTPAAAGVVINVKVHPALQRFTAAHELGHHVLGHTRSLDPETHIQSFTNLALRELEAQFFAAEFLMPIAAVNSIASELGVDKERASAEDVYQLSLRLRTSYQATVNRLQTLQWFGAARARQLRRVPPRDIKREMLHDPLPDPRSDVWRVSRATSRVPAHVGDGLRMTLRETPSTGFRWHLRASEALRIDHDEFVAQAGTAVVGSEGARVFDLSALKAEQTVLRCVLMRQWEQSEAADEFEIVVDSTPRPAPGLYVEQLSELVRS